MKTLISSIALALALALAHPALAADKAPPVDMKKVTLHVKQHQRNYPAAKADLVAQCEGMKEFSDAEKKWFAGTLPEGTYQTPAQVLKALKQK